MQFLVNPPHSEILVRKTYCIGQADLVNHSEHSHVKADRNYAIALPPHSCHHNQSPSSASIVSAKQVVSRKRIPVTIIHGPFRGYNLISPSPLRNAKAAFAHFDSLGLPKLISQVVRNFDRSTSTWNCRLGWMAGFHGNPGFRTRLSRNIDIDRLNNVSSEPHGKLAGELNAKSTMLSVMFKVRVRTFFNIDSGDRE